VTEPGRAPYRKYRTDVREEWIDYNGHLHDGNYAVVLSEANEVMFAQLELSEDYRIETGRAMYTVECHIRYLNESKRGDVLEASTILVSADPKRMRLHTLLCRGDGTPIATGEFFYLHVDDSVGGVTAMPDDRWQLVSALLADHASLDRPAHLGLGVGAPRPT
jgi:acyl-CoA thioester hydrolase